MEWLRIDWNGLELTMEWFWIDYGMILEFTMGRLGIDYEII